MQRKPERREGMRNGKWKQMVCMVVLAVFFIPGLIHAFGPGSSGAGLPPVPPFMVEQYDADGDRRLSAEEEQTAREAFMERFDTDADGELSRREMHAVMRASREAFIEKYDTDGDGEISQEEHEAARADFIALYDTDGDGKLSSDELPGFGPGICRKAHGPGGGHRDLLPGDELE